MRAGLRALFDDDDGEVGRDLFQPDRGGKAGRAAADDHDVIIHGFARGEFFCFGHRLSLERNFERERFHVLVKEKTPSATIRRPIFGLCARPAGR